MGDTTLGSENRWSGRVPQWTRTWWISSCDVKKYAMATFGRCGVIFLWLTALMWWQVHNVLVASAHGARTGVSCGSTKSKKWHSLGSVNLCKNCRNSANKVSGRCFRFLTLTRSMQRSLSVSIPTQEEPPCQGALSPTQADLLQSPSQQWRDAA